jgi:DNA-binding NtrC family response regulator
MIVRNFRAAVLNFEADLIKQALAESGGKVVKASRLLGFPNHQAFISMLNSRHKDLLPQRSQIRPRRAHLIEHPKRKRK